MSKNGDSTSFGLPTIRCLPLDPPPEYKSLRGKSIARISFPDGRSGWLVSSYSEVRNILSDERFSSRPDRAANPFKAVPQKEATELRPGMFIGMDAPEHLRYRRLLVKYFTAAASRRLRPSIDCLVDHFLEEAAQESAATWDLVSRLAQPVPSMVISKLLGVPDEDCADFQSLSARILNLGADPSDTRRASESMNEYMLSLVAKFRRSPPDGTLISNLTRAENGALNDSEIAGMCGLTLLAGHETTANMISLSVYAILGRPGQLTTLLQDDHSLIRGVEELFRYLSVVQFGAIRVAREDILHRGVQITKGETVICSLSSANRDPDAFKDADQLDVSQGSFRHLAFGFGPHQCLGQNLAREEVCSAVRGLFRRFPDVRLGLKDDEIVFRDKMVVYGVESLPLRLRG